MFSFQTACLPFFFFPFFIFAFFPFIFLEYHTFFHLHHKLLYAILLADMFKHLDSSLVVKSGCNVGVLGFFMFGFCTFFVLESSFLWEKHSLKSGWISGRFKAYIQGVIGCFCSLFLLW